MHIILYELYYLRYVSVENSDTLKYIDSFNLAVDNLPSDIKIIFFGNDFNQPVNNIPDGVVEIHFGKSFNQPLDKLPKSVCGITLPDTYRTHNIPGHIIVKYFKVPENIIENTDENLTKIKIDCGDNYGDNYDLFLNDQLKYIQSRSNPSNYK
jgi:hypothetical protein